jgi:GTP-binding protein Era
VPYGVAVSVDAFEEKGPRLAVISATIHVARATYKPIVLGEHGKRLKKIGQSARLEIEALLGKKVFLELFVKVQPDWNKREAQLKELGI